MSYFSNQRITGSLSVSGSITTEALSLSNTVWDDIIIYATNLRGGSSEPAFAILTGSIYSTKFVDGNTDIVYGAFEIPHDYKEGTDLYPHVHWSPSTTDTGNCSWNFAYTIANMNSQFSATSTLTINQSGSGIVNQHQLASTNAVISGGSYHIGTMCNFALSRPSGDTFSGDAFLHSIGIHYQIDTMGSSQIASK